MKKLRSFLLNAVVLTATSLLINSIGVWFSLYISGKIGPQAMGLFQLVMSVYGFAVTLAASGINLAATRLVAEELVKGNRAAVRAVMLRCLSYCMFFGFLSAALLLILSRPIGLFWLKSGETIIPLRMMAVTLPFVSMSSALSGYFTAVRRVSKNAVVLILEQLMKIGCVVFALTVFPPQGLEDACMILIGAGIVSELFSFTVSLSLFLYDRRRYRKGIKEPGILQNLCGIALPIALSAYMRSGLVTIKNLLVPIQLAKYGASSEDALSTFGLLHGVVLPVVLFPAAFLSAFANLIVPELAECRATCENVRNSRRIHYLVGRMLQITLLFSICVAGIFFFFSEQISAASCKNELAADYVKLFAVIVPIMYLDTIVDSMLKGLGEQVSSMRYNIIDASVCMLLVILLLPSYGARGYLVVIFISEILNFALSIGRLIRITRFQVDLLQTVCKPVFSILASSLFVVALSGLFHVEMDSAVKAAVFPIVFSLLGYLLFLILTGGITKEDIKWVLGILKPERGAR